jgi:hypothetical protein
MTTNTKIFIATPMYGGMCTGAYAKAMMSVPGTMVNHGIAVAIRFVMNNSLIPEARNQLVDIFLKDTDSTHMMFIDADLEFDPMDIIHMINADVDVIGGVYPKKRIAWNQVRNAIAAGVPDEKLEEYTGDMVVSMLEDAREATVKATEPFEVKGVGTGFMLIKRSVFERLMGNIETYLNDDDEIVHDFFPLMKEPESGKKMSEDYSFCYLCRQNGIKIYIAPWAAFSHIGTYEFKGSPIRTYKDTK